MLLAGCAQMRMPDLPWPHRPQTPRPGPDAPRPAPDPGVTERPQTDVRPVDPMADVPGDRPLPALSGALERIDCLSGHPDLHARIAFEAQGGQVTSFAYYSRWSAYTCSIDIDRADPATRWRLMPDGATRVQTPHGAFVIRSQPERFVFEFVDVDRVRHCGMNGRTRGTLVVQRNADPPQCAAIGILDR